MEWITAATSSVAVVGTLGGIWLGHWLGRRSTRADRFQDLERLAISDTREWLVDVLDVLSAAAERDLWKVWRLGRAIRDKSYSRQLVELISDEELVEELATTLPEAYEALPRVPSRLSGRLTAIRYRVNRAMLEQEKSVVTTGKARYATQAQEARLLEAAERIQRRTNSMRGWDRLRFLAWAFAPWWLT